MVKTFESWALRKLNSQVTAKNFYSYDDIKLSTYLDIARTGNLSLLAKRKVIVPLQTLIKLWEEIVRRNNDENGSYAYTNNKDLEENFGVMFADYTALKVTIMLLRLRYSKEDVDLLAEKGYRLGPWKTKEQYREALNLLSRRVEGMSTRMQINRKEVERSQKEVTVNDLPTLNKLIAQISIDLPFEIRDDITLAKFNEYKKLIAEKKKENGRNKQR